MDEVLMQVSQSGTSYVKSYCHNNHLYSPACLTDSAGNIVERYRYDAYGRMSITSPTGVSRTHSTVGNTVGFTGRTMDTETGLMYFRARQYSTTLGRFVGRDPWRQNNDRKFKPQPMDGYRDGMSLYGAYFVPGKNDPTGMLVDNFIDVPMPDGSTCKVNCPTPSPQKTGEEAKPCTLAELKPSDDKKCDEELKKALQDPGVQEIMRKIQGLNCPVPPMECRCCTGNCKGAGAWHFSNTAGSIGIYICANQGAAGQSMINYVKHELTHSLQKCRGDSDAGCADRMKRELEAYRAGGYTTFNSAFSSAVWSSCAGGKCKPSDINAGLASAMNSLW